jgi:hypothetical protein
LSFQLTSELESVSGRRAGVVQGAYHSLAHDHNAIKKQMEVMKDLLVRRENEIDKLESK